MEGKGYVLTDEILCKPKILMLSQILAYSICHRLQQAN